MEGGIGLAVASSIESMPIGLPELAGNGLTPHKEALAAGVCLQ